MNDKERIQLNLRLDGNRELMDAIKAEASTAGISVNAWVVRTLQSAIGKTPIAIPTPELDKTLDNTLDNTIEQKLVPVLDKMLADKFAAIEERLGKLRA
ncbi:toxin-antitoxin system HicB family antitoxin [Microcoleus sp. A006_D1]|uniref:hypothetical protein n=1 Tax=Microcoleus sp. A006_D1 TaxID=3055267 RepID=UPI002FD634FA